MKCFYTLFWVRNLNDVLQIIEYRFFITLRFILQGTIDNNPLIARPLSDIAALGTTFNVLSYDVIWAEYRTNHLPDAEQKRYEFKDAGYLRNN